MSEFPRSFIHVFGFAMIFIVLGDIYLAVLYPRSGKGWVGIHLSKTIWRVFRGIAQAPIWQRRGDRSQREIFLSYCGPTLLVMVVSVWIALLLVGFACVIWSELGSEIRATDGTTPPDFVTALYYSGCILTTLGLGDLVPQTPYLRMLTLAEAMLGFSIFTLTITYLLAVYSALTHRNIFALSLHHRTLQTGDAAELLARLGADGDLSNLRSDLTNISGSLLTLLESHHAYPVVHYFRFQETHYALARIGFLAMETMTLICSALHPDRYRSLIRSATVIELGNGGQHFLMELAKTFLPAKQMGGMRQAEDLLRGRYYQAIERLKQESIEVNPDLEAGADLYISLRRQWEPYVMTIAQYMAYDWQEIAPAESEFIHYMSQVLYPPRVS